MKTIAFFNNKGGVGNTSLVYHLAWMFSKLGKRLVVADLDPQANVSNLFLGEDVLADFWEDAYQDRKTVDGNIAPQLDGEGGIKDPPHIEEIEGSNVGLLVGDINLSQREDAISHNWVRCLDGDKVAFRITTALARMIANAGKNHAAELALIDMGHTLGAINRAAIIASDYVVIPLAPDSFSLQGMKSAGPALAKWREEWKARKKKKPAELDISVPEGDMRPLGYAVMNHALRLYGPVGSYLRSIDKFPAQYRNSVLGQESLSKAPDFDKDPHMLAYLKDYRSLMHMAQKANKPIFMLGPGDGAIGSYLQAVRECGVDFRRLAENILSKLEGESA